MAFSGFTRNVFRLTLGAGIAQSLPFLLSPVLSRLYPPGEYAIFAVFLAASTLGTVLVTWRYEMAIVLPDHDGEAADLVRLCLILTSVIGLSVWGLLSAIARAGYEAPLRHLTGGTPLVLTLAIVFNGIYAALSYWTNRKKRYGSLAVARVLQAAIGVGIPVIAPRWFGSNGLVFGNAMNSLPAALFLAASIGQRDWEDFRGASWQRVRKVAARYAEFPRVTVPHGLMDALQNNLLVLLIEHFFGSLVLGLYSFSFRMLKAPLGLFGSALSQVFYRDAAENLARSGSIDHDVKRTLKVLLILSIPIYLVIIAIGGPFAGQIFGSQWAGVGVTLQLLAPWILLNFLLSPLSQVPLILGRQRTWFLVSLGDNILIVATVTLAGALGWSANFMLGALSLFNVIYLGAALRWILQISRRSVVGTGGPA